MSGDEAKAANQRIEEWERTLRGSQEELSEMAEAAETAARQREEAELRAQEPRALQMPFKRNWKRGSSVLRPRSRSSGES